MRPVTRGNSRQLTFLFVAVLGAAAVSLVWLAWQLFQQDRALYRQRALERQESAADLVVRTLAQTLADAVRGQARANRADGVVSLRLDGRQVIAEPRAAAAWLPGSPASPEPPPGPFAAAEQVEFRGDPRQAIPIYAELVRAADEPLRAGALMRVARIERRLGRVDAAIVAYRDLASIERVQVNGMPVDLVARRLLCDLLREHARPEMANGEIAALRRDFLASRWTLTRDAWELVAAEVGQWTDGAIEPTEDQQAVALAAEWLLAGPDAQPGARVLTGDNVRVTVARSSDGDVRATVIVPSVIERWVAAAEAQLPPGSGKVAVMNDRGVILAGAAVPPSASVIRRLPSETTLPWAVTVTSGADLELAAEFQSRRRLFTAGFAALGLFFAGGGFLLWRVVQRELAVARLQGEFVSTVSHEFRTPVTSLRHTIELLQEDDEVPREHRASFYAVLARSTERLDRLVESLLDFGRMESGRKPYDLQPLDPAALVTAIVCDFQRDPASRGYQIDVVVDPGTPASVPGDASALSHALWNLLDNAVKYSPDRAAVRVSVSEHRGGVAIAVRDEGIGIPASERSDIFLKFVRGQQASRRGIKGTGVGLAIVSHITRAHGGTVQVESVENQGSTFRLVLPSA
ncbi:MAG: HAMP domain-containing histidine kinase [Acidobacteriota bacterium]|nr:HAMP domain-containing histidine kinase [Acidobacteriota bacterium]